jgi:RNA polymerase sigma-70 factor (ECF subfamily)
MTLVAEEDVPTLRLRRALLRIAGPATPGCDQRPLPSPAGLPEAAGADVRTVSDAAQRAAAGEEWLKALYAEHSRALLAYTMRLTGDRFAAEDVVQDTLLRAWHNQESVHRAGDAVRGWLFTVAKNIVIDRARARAARPTEVADPEQVQAVSEDHADPVIEGITVYQGLARLSPEHRAMLVEVYYRGCTVAEAAATLGIPEGTARSRTFYALRALRTIMQEPGESGKESGI